MLYSTSSQALQLPLMILTGMLIGGMQFSKIFSYKRLWLIVFLRLIVFPLPILLILKLSGMANLVNNGQWILLITLLAASAPSASAVTQMSQVYGKDPDYACAINVATTLLCILTMPLMVSLYPL